MIKKYIKVNADFTPSGAIEPRTITWEDGHKYEIVRVKQRVPAASTKVGGCGVRYTVVIDGMEKYLWLEGDKWFVEAKDGTV